MTRVLHHTVVGAGLLLPLDAAKTMGQFCENRYWKKEQYEELLLIRAALVKINLKAGRSSRVVAFYIWNVGEALEKLHNYTKAAQAYEKAAVVTNDHQSEPVQRR